MFLKNSELRREGYSLSDQKSPVCVSLSLIIPQTVVNYMQFHSPSSISSQNFSTILLWMVFSSSDSQTITLKSEHCDKDNFVHKWCRNFHLVSRWCPMLFNYITLIQSEDLARCCLPIELQQNHTNKKGQLLHVRKRININTS